MYAFYNDAIRRENVKNNIECYSEYIFDDIRHVDENGMEYWLARELQKVLEYKEWRHFYLVIEKAICACEASNIKASYHFVGVDKMIKLPKDGFRIIADYKLSRYACYLIVQNADSRKKVIALGQTYFAIQTRKQEINDRDYQLLSEDEKRLYTRNLTKKENYFLNQTARDAGVTKFDQFHNEGYKGLYNGETANDIAKRKKLRYREDILDNMGSAELAANLFRITQTDEKIKNEHIYGQKEANQAHFNVGRNVRKFMKDNSGAYPENLPTPEKSLKQIEKDKKNIQSKLLK